MAGLNEDRDRQVVPLWRSFETTKRCGELASGVSPVHSQFSDEMVSELAQDWRDTPGLAVAEDFVSVAMVLGRFGIADSAAQFVISHGGAPAGAVAVASTYLSRKSPTTSTQPFTTQPRLVGLAPAVITERLRAGVREVRKQVAAYHNNPMLWCDLARLHASLGTHDKADRAMGVAMALAPQNRFVLRAASRFFLHKGMKDRAHRVLARAACVRHDPWVLSAEIATAASIGRTSGNIKAARAMLKSTKHGPFHLSELASALGTLESRAGNLRVARPLITFSLQQPAENAIAQAAWLHRNIGGVGREAGSTSSFEANTWFASRAADWDAAIEQARGWQADQPFSSRPAVFGSHLASVMENHADAIAFARQGILGNPDDFTLRNNLAFSLASIGDVGLAAEVLKHLTLSRLNSNQLVVLLATSGFISFRAGDANCGRKSYDSAIQLSLRSGGPQGGIAKIYYALEELRVGADKAEAIRMEALEGAKSFTEPWQLVLVNRLRNF